MVLIGPGTITQHLLGPNAAWAAEFVVPPLTGPVIDEVGLLDERTKSDIADSLFNLHKERGIQLQVYITKSLQGEAIEAFAIKLFDQWKLGDEKTDKGVLFIIAPNEKRMRIEVGQGLEGDLPDVIAKRIIADVVKPYFQKNQFNKGVIQGILQIEKALGVNTDSSLPTTLTQKEANDDSNDNSERPRSIFNGVVILIVIGIWLLLFMINPSLALYILFSIMRGGGGGGYGGGGRGRDDSWSGGGGKSSGGGASGGW